MLEKTIKQILVKKLKDWCDSIEDEKIKGMIQRHAIVTGGCFVSMLQNETPNDFDIYFNSKDSAIEIAQYYQKVWNESHPNEQTFGITVFDDNGKNINSNDNAVYDDDDNAVYDNEYYTVNKGRIKLWISSSGVTGDIDAINADEEMGMNVQSVVEELDEANAEKEIEKEKKPYHPVFVSSNAITLSDKIQIITRFYGEPKDIHDTFDFEHTRAYFHWGLNELVIPKEVYECVMNKTLRYTGSRYPVCSVFRLRKFLSRGWTINAGQLLKMCMQISDLNLQNVYVLEDQLIGVDSLYFMNLIDQFQKQKEKDADFVLTTGYIISIIDKIF